MSNLHFRAWDKVNEKMIYLPKKRNDVSCWLFFEDGSVALDADPQNKKLSDIDSEQLEVMLWSGTVDRTKTKVYEDDILHVQRAITHVPSEFLEDWNHNDPIAQERYRKQLIRDGLVLRGVYEEVGVVKKSLVKWSLWPYVYKTVSFENGRVTKHWHQATKARQLRTSRGLWVTEVVGTRQENAELVDLNSTYYRPAST